MIVQARADGGRGRGLEGQEADCPVLALEQSDRKGDKTKRNFPGSLLSPLGFKRKESLGGTDCKREMSLIQAFEPGKVGYFRWFLDCSSCMETKIQRDWLGF